MSLRALPTQLCMAEAVPWGQRYNYHTRHPVEMVLDPQYFLPVRGQLRPGDEIRVCRVVDGRVRQLFDLLVVQATPDLEMHMLGQIIEIPDRAPPPAPKVDLPDERYIGSNGRVQWNVGKRMFDVFDGAALVHETADKAEAWRVAQGEQPLPQKAPEAA